MLGFVFGQAEYDVRKGLLEHSLAKYFVEFVMINFARVLKCADSNLRINEFHCPLVVVADVL